MGRTRAKHQYTDFSHLLEEFNIEQKKHENVVEAPSSDLDMIKPEEETINHVEDSITEVVKSFIYHESEYRHKCLSDESVAFAIVRTKGKIHDKTCSELKSFDDSEIEFTDEYDNSKCQCMECETKAAIRFGAKDNDIDAHEKFFKKVGATSDFIHKLYITMGFKTTAVNNVLTVWYKDDVWKIISHDKSCIVELKHNNYVPLKGKERKFTEGFHTQSERTHFINAINYIYAYEYLDHFKAPEPEVKPAEPEAKSAEVTFAYNESYIGEKNHGAIGRIFAKPVYWYLKKYVFHGKDKNSPLPNKRCLIIYKGKDGIERIRAGAYQPDRKCFSVAYCGKTDKISEKKVKYWVVLDELDEIFGGAKEK